MNNIYNDEQNERNFSKVIIITVSIVLLVIVVGCILLVGISVFKNITHSDTQDYSKYMTRIEDTLKRIKEKYIEDVDIDKLIDGAVSGMVEATEDPYTRYMDEEEYKELLTEGTQTYGGLGIHITFDADSQSIKIIGIMPNTPAVESDLKIGDLITSVDSTQVNMKNYYECTDKLKGEANTQVKLTIKRDGNTIEKTITRADILPNNVESEIMNNDIGYIHIWSFDNNVYKQFKEEYDKLKGKNIKGLIIDVRNNPGGLVSDTVSILKEMLPKCDMVKLVYKDQSEKVYKCDGKNEIKIPVAVLVNSSSASASEILASAIKDSKIGVLVGTKTFGKGVVQEIEPLDDRGALAITVAKYYTASGVEIHKNGIEPDIAVDIPEEYSKSYTIPRDKDTQLIKAIEYINSKK